MPRCSPITRRNGVCDCKEGEKLDQPAPGRADPGLRLITIRSTAHRFSMQHAEPMAYRERSVQPDVPRQVRRSVRVAQPFLDDFESVIDSLGLDPLAYSVTLDEKWWLALGATLDLDLRSVG